MQFLILLAAGLVLGAAGGLLGIGGGIIAIPLLSLYFGMDQHLAQGTALLLIVPNVVLACFKYHRRQPLDLRAVAAMCTLAAVFAFVAARLTIALPAQWLQWAFASFLVVVALYYLYAGASLSRTPQRAPLLASRHLPWLGVLSGVMSGVFSVGGGLVVTPALVSIFGFSQTRAQGFALAMVVPGALAAFASATLAGHVSWQIGIPLAIGGLSSVSWGVALAYRLPAAMLRGAFSLALLVSAALMFAWG